MLPQVFLAEDWEGSFWRETVIKQASRSVSLLIESSRWDIVESNQAYYSNWENSDPLRVSIMGRANPSCWWGSESMREFRKSRRSLECKPKPACAPQRERPCEHTIQGQVRSSGMELTRARVQYKSIPSVRHKINY